MHQPKPEKTVISPNEPILQGSSSQLQLSEDGLTITKVPQIKAAVISEIAGLELLTTLNVFKTPKIISVNEDSLQLQYIAGEPGSNTYWQHVGEKLAQLHQQTNSHYGIEFDNYLGTVKQNNTQQTHWGTFYSEQRLRPLLNNPLLTRTDLDMFTRLLAKLEQYLDNSEPPALIHGDLWADNILFHNNEAYLIDPAVYYASREIEIAYLEFVGNAFEPLLQAYHANYPLDVEYHNRKKLYWLYPYLVHLHMFGESYLPGLRAVLRYFL